MLRFFNKRIHNRKGFTLIELIVVIAIMGILAVIAVPRFLDIQARAAINSDAAAAEEMINAARIVETEQFSAVDPGTALTAGADWAATVTGGDTYMVLPITPQSGGAFAVALSGDDYQVTWTPTGRITSLQTYTEGSVFTVNP